jgi:magnesium-transporting ATPase (P-type)
VHHQLAEKHNGYPTILNWLRIPVLAPIVARRAMAAWILGFAFLQLTMTTLNRPFWYCPFREGFAFPCPGCGMTRAMIALCQGNWHTAMEMHAFAPLCILAVAFVLGTALLPNAKRESLANRLQQWERKTGLTGIIVLTMISYWLLRLGFSERYYRLVM